MLYRTIFLGREKSYDNIGRQKSVVWHRLKDDRKRV